MDGEAKDALVGHEDEPLWPLRVLLDVADDEGDEEHCHEEAVEEVGSAHVPRRAPPLEHR